MFSYITRRKGILSADHRNDEVTFTINGHTFRVNHKNSNITMSLNTFIRDIANLKGTKFMCKEGGCGSCIVNVSTSDPVTKKNISYAVNSCLIPVLACHGMVITTIEGIGSRSEGYNKVQKYLAGFNGSQCGYCSPGQIMNMYSLLKANPHIKAEEVEDSFGGNTCRCTGYRPILDAFKALSSNPPDSLQQKTIDIEDLLKGCNLNGGDCEKDCEHCAFEAEYDPDFVEVALAPKTLNIQFDQNHQWIRVDTISEIFNIFKTIGSASYQLVAGNTAQGAYRPTVDIEVYIDINAVAELKTSNLSGNPIRIGANVSLNNFITLLRRMAQENQQSYSYANQLADHITLVANVPVRNVGTIAGNLSLKYQHREFPSDIFLILETIGATLSIRDMTGAETTATPLQYLDLDMNKKVITKVLMPSLSSDLYTVLTYKVMPRAQNVIALVNAGFKFQTNTTNGLIVSERPAIVFGNISAQFVHAHETEAFLNGKSLRNEDIVKEAFEILSKEVSPSFDPVGGSQSFRKQLSLGLFYKFILKLDPLSVDKSFRSGAEILKRPLSSGTQKIVTDKEKWPDTQPIIKLEAMQQCSGEAEYIDDIPKYPDELHGAFVITDRSAARLDGIDASAALKVPGVVAFFTASDIPGENTFTAKHPFLPENEEIFCSGKILYAGQPVGMIVARTRDIALMSAKKVFIKYKNQTKPLLTIKDVLESGDMTRIRLDSTTTPTATTQNNVAYRVKGEHKMEDQYHYTMELQAALVVPTDVGLDVFATSQWMENSQGAIARALNIHKNEVNIYVKRIGGAFGSRIVRGSLVSAACAVAAYKLCRPVKMVLDMETNMRSIGKRYQNLARYEVAVDDTGKIQSLDVDMYENSGSSFNEDIMYLTVDGFTHVYDTSTYNIKFYLVKTDIPSACFMRAPGTLEAIGVLERIMDHIAHVSKLDPIQVRTVNLSESFKDSILEIFSTVMQSSEYTERRETIENFNKVIYIE